MSSLREEASRGQEHAVHRMPGLREGVAREERRFYAKSPPSPLRQVRRRRLSQRGVLGRRWA